MTELDADIDSETDGADGESVGLDADVDAAALADALAGGLGTAVTDLEVLADGLNLLISIATAAEDEAYVLRCPRKLRAAAYMNDLRSEYRVMEALVETDVPTPEPVWYCEDDSILGEEFYVMTHLDGDPVHLGTDLPEHFQHPSARERIGGSLIDTLATIHTTSTDEFAAACGRRMPQEQVAVSTDRLEAAIAVTGHDFQPLREVADWLAENVPEESPVGLVHGDYRPGNVLFSGEREPTIEGVIDWETAAVGDPLSELGYLLLRWRDPGDPTPDMHEIERRHPDSDALEGLREQHEHGLAPFTADPGSPSRSELIARYEAQTGVTFENRAFYRALAPFMLATVWADLHRQRVETDTGSDYEPQIEYMALIADQVIRDATEE